MWKCKTAAELELTERKHRRARFSPRWPLLIAAGIALLVGLMAWAGFRGQYAPWGEPVPVSHVAVAFLRSFLILFPVVYVIRLGIPKTAPLDGTLICTECFETAAAAEGPHCRCGGHCEELYRWKWVPQEPLSETRNR